MPRLDSTIDCLPFWLWPGIPKHKNHQLMLYNYTFKGKIHHNGCIHATPIFHINLANREIKEQKLVFQPTGFSSAWAFLYCPGLFSRTFTHLHLYKVSLFRISNDLPVLYQHGGNTATNADSKIMTIDSNEFKPFSNVWLLKKLLIYWIKNSRIVVLPPWRYCMYLVWFYPK